MRKMGRNTKGFGNARRARFMSLLLILCLVMSSIIPAPECKADSYATDEKKLVFEDSGYKLELSESSGWESGYVAEVVVRNTGVEEIRNWSVVAVMKEGNIKNSWNATNKRLGTDEVIFESEKHNMIIKSGEKTSFGFEVAGGKYDDIISLRLIPGKVLSTDRADITFKETGSWDGHRIMEGTITNHSGKAIRDWSISFEMEGKITNIWNVVNAGECEGTFHVKSCDYNAVIEEGESVTFGFEVSYDTEPFRGLRNVRIYAGSEDKADEEKEPQETPALVPTVTMEPDVTETPVATDTSVPTDTPSVTEEPGEKGDISEDDIEFIDVENRDWNMDMIHANDPEVQTAKENADRKIRVTMLDSGINYSREVDVVERRNFVEGEDEMISLFEDGSGHGTAIAEVLASNPKAISEEETGDADVDDEFGKYTYYGETEDDSEEKGETAEEETAEAWDENTVSFGDLLDSGYEWTEGVNPNIELYSGKILDKDNETTVGCVIEGIEWAMENDTDILSLSIGMDKDSEKLHKVIKKASESGMLIIAAVGDDEKVDYPAAYPEVMAVGMVNSMGESAGVRSEVTAPGDFIVSRGAFDSMEIFSGSSMAVPHVVGLASILWQKDTTKEAEFIRGLIDVSANAIPEDECCEYGLIDCKYALESYGEFEKQVRENSGILKYISRNQNPDEVKEEVAEEIDNESAVETEEEIEKLHGNWDSKEHQKFVSNKYEHTWTNGTKYVTVLRSGISFVDSEKNNPDCYGMRAHPWFHGFHGGVPVEKGSSEKTKVSNYMTSFRTLVELADDMRRDGDVRKLATDSGDAAVKNAMKGIKKAFRDKEKVGSETWGKIDGYCAKSGQSVPKDCRSLLIYGMALHTLGDTFSHSSYGMEKVMQSQNGTGVKTGKIVWKRFAHGDSKTGKWYADNTESRKLRYDSAKKATEKAIKSIEVDFRGKLVGYKNIGTTVNAFYVKEPFKQLKEMNTTIKDSQGKSVEIPKMKYVKEGYALGDFEKYYKQETNLTGRTSKELEKYVKYIDREQRKSQMKKCSVIQVKLDKKMGSFDKNSSVYVKMDGKKIITQELNGGKATFLLPKEWDYKIECLGSKGVFTVCTIEEDILYDKIGRTMKKNKPESEEEFDEDEDMELCDMEDYALSTDCLVKGKVVRFDYASGSGSIEDMPELSGAKVSFRSQDSDIVYETKTKKDGSYRIEIPAGKYDVTYENGKKYIVVEQFLTITADMDLYKNTTVELVDDDWFGEGYMAGYLYDKTTGRFLSGVTIQIYKGIGYYDKAPVRTVNTDATGYFYTDFLDAGAYTFVISKDGYETLYCYETILGDVGSFVPGIALNRK